MTSDKKNTLFTSLANLIEIRRESLVELTQDLIKIPTLNPPGENYLEICEYLNKRLSKSGLETQIIRAKGAPGDSDKYPRWNIIGRKEGRNSGECIHFNSHTDVVEVGLGWKFDPFAGQVFEGKV